MSPHALRVPKARSNKPAGKSYALDHASVTLSHIALDHVTDLPKPSGDTVILVIASLDLLGLALFLSLHCLLILYWLNTTDVQILRDSVRMWSVIIAHN